MVCHELREPLNIISFSISLLKRNSAQWTEEKKRPYLEHIQTAVTQINQLLDQVLMLGKAEAGKLKLQPKQVDLIAFCIDIVTQMQTYR